MKLAIMLVAGIVLVAGAANAQSADQVSIESAGSKQVIAGAVNANGTAQLAPTTFTVTHPSTGRYVIKFKTAFTKDAICLFNSLGPGTRIVLGVTQKTCDVTFVDLSTGNVSDTLFSFIATNAG